MAILRVNLRPEKARRSANHHDNEVARGLVQADHVSQYDSNANRADSPTNGNETKPDTPPEMWQQIEWRLVPYTTVGRAVISATQRLEDGGSATANLDAQVLLAHVLGVVRSWLFAHYDYQLMPAEAQWFSELVGRRTAAEPVAYLTGKKEFYGIELTVDPRVLIPRPETEQLVDAVLDHIASRSTRSVKVADVGTGSGAIALAVAMNCPEAKIYATDISSDALEVAAQNVSRSSGANQITLLQGDLLEPLPEKVDIIVANLPYVRTEEYNTLMRDVRDYEPQLALKAGPEGLDAYERLLRQAKAHLNPGGVLYVEIGHNQGDAMIELVERLIPDARFVSVRQDYAGHDRLLLVAI